MLIFSLATLIIFLFIWNTINVGLSLLSPYIIIYVAYSLSLSLSLLPPLFLSPLVSISIYISTLSIYLSIPHSIIIYISIYNFLFLSDSFPIYLFRFCQISILYRFSIIGVPIYTSYFFLDAGSTWRPIPRLPSSVTCTFTLLGLRFLKPAAC